jgi:hypothetical protein
VHPNIPATAAADQHESGSSYAQSRPIPELHGAVLSIPHIAVTLLGVFTNLDKDLTIK